MPDADLAGVYITDDFIDVLIGADAAPQKKKSTLSQLVLKNNDGRQFDQNLTRRFSFQGNDVATTIIEASDWIAAKTTRLRSVGIACYGPFSTIDRRDRDSKHAEYGQLQSTSHGRLSVQSLPSLFGKSLSRHFQTMPLITVDTDVSAAVTGEVYMRTFTGNDKKRDRELDDQVFAFVKVSLGIGAAFMRASTSWQGRLHPEVAQFQMPRWKSGDPDCDADEENFNHLGARNKGSIEAMASVSALDARFTPLKFTDISQAPKHVAWEREAWYLAQLLWAMTCVISPHRIVMGGRVMAVPGLLDRTRQKFADIAGNPSFPYYKELDDLDAYITISAASTGKEIGKPGVVGALCLAAMEAKKIKT